MAMRSQLYEWKQNTTSSIENVSSSIFIGGTGNNITKPAETTATQFVVIEQVGSTPSNPTSYSQTGAGGIQNYMQVRINTTDYFLDPDNVPNDGIPGSASPYPRSVNFQPSFNLYPDVYVLPGQVWDVLVTWYNNGGLPTTATACVSGSLRCFTKYTLYDGPDALIANKLLEMGISINPGNVDWYKRSLLSAQ